MEPATYAVVGYLSGELKEFVDLLRLRFNPECANWRPHVTVLPLRSLNLTVEDAVKTLRSRCEPIKPFQVAVHRITTFLPISGVVYLSFGDGTDSLLHVHEQLNAGILEGQEPHSFVPHVTIAQDMDETTTHHVMEQVTEEWSRFAGETCFTVTTLSLVRQAPEKRWIDLFKISL